MEDPAFLNDRIASLWDFANTWSKQVSDNDRFRYLAWLSDPTASQVKKDKINAVIAWSDSIFVEYYARKAVVLDGGEANTDFSALGSPPFTFFEIYTTP